MGLSPSIAGTSGGASTAKVGCLNRTHNNARPNSLSQDSRDTHDVSLNLGCTVTTSVNCDRKSETLGPAGENASVAVSQTARVKLAAAGGP